MRHDPVDPAHSPGPERPAIVPPEPPLRVFGPRLDRLERRTLATIAASEQELTSLANREAHDDAARTQAAGVLSDVLTRERRELEAIAAARARLLAGTFGRCRRCHGQIPRARLLARPTVDHCVTCQRELSRGLD